MIVKLTPEEMSQAVDVANKRYLYSLLTKGRDSVDKKEWTEGFLAHLAGATGEVAVAKALDMQWPGWINRFKSRPDLGNRIEVRHRRDGSRDLIVRKDDDSNSLFVLTTGQDNEVVVHGYIKGKVAKKKIWLAAHGGKPEAYFVPRANLMPIEMLRSEDENGA